MAILRGDEMAFKKITDADVKGKGNVGQPDTPGVSTAEMQRIMDEIPREVIIPAFNALIDALADKTSAAALGITAPDGITGSTVQEVVNALLTYVNAHKSNEENPHAVTAEQVDAYTKKQTDDAINQKVTEIGSGDMAQAVYDPTGQKRDIFAAAEAAKNDAIMASAKSMTGISAMYTATLTLENWEDYTGTDFGSDYKFKQTAAAIPDNSAAPTVTEKSTFTSGVGFLPTHVKDTDEALADVLNIINDGCTVTGPGNVTVYVYEKPTAEIHARWGITT